MAAIHDLVAQIGDERLRERLEAEWARATRECKFGLVFKGHLPELPPLPKARPRKGDLLAPRGGSVEDMPLAEAGSARELVLLARRAGTEAVFAALAETVTYRVGAVRSQSALRRYLGIARELTIDELDDAARDDAKRQIVVWLADTVRKLEAAGAFDALAKPCTWKSTT